MPNFQVQIKSGCILVPNTIPPAGEKCRKESTITYNNQTGGTVTLNFADPPGNPFGVTPPVTVPPTGATFTIQADVSQPTTYSYTPVCSGALGGPLDGGGIIIVDPPVPPPKRKPKKAAARKPAGKKTRAKAKTSRKGKGKGGAKKKSSSGRKKSKSTRRKKK